MRRRLMSEDKDKDSKDRTFKTSNTRKAKGIWQSETKYRKKRIVRNVS
jgi:hypothetical protein